MVLKQKGERVECRNRSKVVAGAGRRHVRCGCCVEVVLDATAGSVLSTRSESASEVVREGTQGELESRPKGVSMTRGEMSAAEDADAGSRANCERDCWLGTR